MPCHAASTSFNFVLPTSLQIFCLGSAKPVSVVANVCANFSLQSDFALTLQVFWHFATLSWFAASEPPGPDQRMTPQLSVYPHACQQCGLMFVLPPSLLIVLLVVLAR